MSLWFSLIDDLFFEMQNTSVQSPSTVHMLVSHHFTAQNNLASTQYAAARPIFEYSYLRNVR